MTSKTTNNFSPEVRTRAVRMVLAMAEENSTVIADLRRFKAPTDVVVSYVLGQTVAEIIRGRGRR